MRICPRKLHYFYPFKGGQLHVMHKVGENQYRCYGWNTTHRKWYGGARYSHEQWRNYWFPCKLPEGVPPYESVSA